MNHSDYLIIGAGPGGYEIAGELARQGKSVTIIERDLPGGTCLNRGCIPTKALAASAELILSLHSASQFGVNVSEVTADYAKAHERALEVVTTLRSDIESLLSKANFVRGEARFISDSEVAVGEDVYTAGRIIIATGSRPAPLRCSGAELALTSDDLLKSGTKVSELMAGDDKSIVIVGGGVIGLEFACILNAFGYEVSVVEFCKEVLPGIDQDLAKRLRMRLAKRGISFYCGTAVNEIRSDGTVVCSGKKGEIELHAATVVAAVGRRPVLPPGIENTSIAVSERGFIEVNPDTMQTSAKGVYAVGDVTGLCMLAHAASAQARLAVGLPADTKLIPAVVFTDPQLATAGSAEGTVTRIPYASNGKALADGTSEGIVKLVTDPDTGRLTGCHVLGAHAADLVAEATVAISCGLTLEDLAAVTHAHPSLSELLCCR